MLRQKNLNIYRSILLYIYITTFLSWPKIKKKRKRHYDTWKSIWNNSVKKFFQMFNNFTEKVKHPNIIYALPLPLAKMNNVVPLESVYGRILFHRKSGV